MPGANNISEFWDLLVSGRCSIGEIGEDRFSKFRYLHPKSGQAGKTYTFRAGVLDDVWGFDPSVFSLSPREALQMDPQQRLLLMLVWEALEEAGLTLSDVAGSNIGVFVGNSGSDHSNRFFFDPASSDSFMMTGNTLSLISNRISYVFDLHGPSFTVDTACSSSLVALDLAMKRLQSGEIDTAIVAGVNLLLSPFPFVGFSAASMLSPQGMCRPFDENANGYVRAEGGVVLVLQRSDAFDPVAQRSFGRVVTSGINSDGRTSGVALPSPELQGTLLQKVYSELDLDLDALAFIEAHGTGTRVGDPAETFALGRVIGRRRSKLLPIGSVKSNIGHLEPASGLASVLKSLLALENDLLPASLNIERPNPDIPFEELNLSLNRELSPLEQTGDIRYAGINNFGFGGTNAHVLVSDSEFNLASEAAKAKGRKAAVRGSAAAQEESRLVVLSAKTEDALRAMADATAQSIASQDDASLADWSCALGWQRSLMDERLVVLSDSKEGLCKSLEDFAKGETADNAILATAASGRQDPVFVYSGNGSQFAGMGQVAYHNNAVFAACFDEIDQFFVPLSGWSLKEKLFADDLKEELSKTSVAQPLLFALQVALTRALMAGGLAPSGAMGHSVGEVAAAWACGALSLKQAVEVIYLRSHHQEAVAGHGRMAVIKLSREETEALLEKEGFSDIEVSAVNTEKSLTLSGPTEALQAFMKFARKKRLASKMLEINYPFHSKSVDVIRDGLLADLKDVVPAKASIPFYSSVSGDVLDGSELSGDYWWRNVRQPVQFYNAVEAAFADGRQQFIEIGPRAILKSYIGETARDKAQNVVVVDSFRQKDPEALDPVMLSIGRAIANGLSFDRDKVFGKKLKTGLVLPHYAWQLKPFKIGASREAFDVFNDSSKPHALLGQQIRSDEHVWTTELDTALIPYLEHHKVDGKVILPGAAFAEMALSAAQEVFGTDRVELRDLDLLQALMLDEDQSASVMTRVNEDTGVAEIFSRRRLVDDEWQLHAKCRVAVIPGNVGLECAEYDLTAPSSDLRTDPERIKDIYDISRSFGLDFGPAFQRMTYCERFGDEYIDMVFGQRDDFVCPRELMARPYALHPLDFDASFHGLNTLYESLEQGEEKMAFIPVRLGCLRIYQSGVTVRSARVHVLRSNSRGIKADIDLFADDGSLVASLRDGRFRASALVQRQGLDRLTYSYSSLRQALAGDGIVLPTLDRDGMISAVRALSMPSRTGVDDGQLLLQAACRRGAYDGLMAFADKDGLVSLASLPPLTAFDDLSGDEADEDLRARALHRKQLFGSLVEICEQSGLAEVEGDGWKLAGDPDLPAVSEVLQLLLSENPRWSAECVMVNHALALLPQLLRAMDRPAGSKTRPHDLYSNDLFDQHFGASPLADAHVAQIKAGVEAILANWPQGRALRVLELGVGGARLTKQLLPLVEARGGLLVASDTNKLIIDRLGIQFSGSISFAAVALHSDLEGLKPFGPFDLVVSANGLQIMDKASALLEWLPDLMAEDGFVLASLSDGDVFEDIVFGQAEQWFDGSIDPAFPVSAYGDAESWRSWLEDAGLDQVAMMPFCDGEGSADLTGAYLLTAVRKAIVAAKEANVVELSADYAVRLVLRDDRDADEQAFFARLQASDRTSHLAQVAINHEGGLEEAVALLKAEKRSGPVDVIFSAGAFGKAGASMDRIAPRLHQLAEFMRQTSDIALRLWIIAPGGYPTGDAHGVDPVQSGIWAFGRTAGNEYGDHDVRLVDFDSALSTAECADRLAAVLEEPGDEREMLLENCARQTVRIVRGKAGGAASQDDLPSDAASKLYHPRSGSFDRLEWIPTRRRAPKKGEVEIAVVAAGLNFRDVMWAQGLLPEEALEDGFAGPTLGFECSGRIVAVGEGVASLKIGDPVMTMAPASFSSHVTVIEKAVSLLPEDFDLVAAATMPVAFLTSYYALHYLAHLEEGEWVLIHGAAGAVGLAALQIAKWKGARIIATAGNEEKRNFLKMLGADHVLNTRSLDFVDQVRAITREADGKDGEGVDVVLNSLFGEAMERSLELLRPFGRFLELGKRDFYGNSKIGLRPFRRNISYFGIDADQLMTRQPARAKRLFNELSDLIAEEQFTQLPYRLFESEDIVDAFRLMQRSGHIGKIVVKAPAPLAMPADGAGFAVSDTGHHILVGGLGGFGFETALWLAEQGAQSVVLTSRSGKVTEEVLALKEKLAAKGCALTVEACDVSDAKALGSLLKGLRKDRPIKGIMHMAAVLDDTLIANTSDEQFDKVLGPKVIGGDNLDQLTRPDALDYFWLFSSVSVLMGNPGQANYVAANSYMDGLARKRRLEGLPALSIGWGAITDVGILARDTQTAEILARTTGGIEFKARQALDRLVEYLGKSRQSNPAATITIAPMNWAYASNNLAIMKTPSYGLLMKEAAQSSNRDQQSLDVEALIEGLDDVAARTEIAKILAQEVAVIFRMPVEEINLNRSLTDIGMDSLMGMELRTAAQQKLNIEIPMGAISDGTSIEDIAVKVLERIRGGGDKALSFTEESLIHQHAGTNEDAALVAEKLSELRKGEM